MTSFRYLGSDWLQSAANFLLSLDQTLLLPLTVHSTYSNQMHFLVSLCAYWKLICTKLVGSILIESDAYSSLTSKLLVPFVYVS